eukprot:1968137-Rhodomonas_salina.1
MRGVRSRVLLPPRPPPALVSRSGLAPGVQRCFPTVLSLGNNGAARQLPSVASASISPLPWP